MERPVASLDKAAASYLGPAILGLLTISTYIELFSQVGYGPVWAFTEGDFKCPD